MESNNKLIDIKNLQVYFPINEGILIQRHRGDCKAVDDISFNISKGETLGLVGESGCGKSTTGRAILQLIRPTAGHVYFKGEDLTKSNNKELRKKRREMQIVFQDPYASLNPRASIGEILSEPIEVHKICKSKSEKNEYIKELMSMVGLAPGFIARYPHEFSGGQRQRIVIARALAVKPEFIVCDEPVSALDVSIQAQIINLLCDLQSKFFLTYLFIAHDLSVVRHMSNRIAVMYLGKLVEIADDEELYHHAQHPYSLALLSSVPLANPKEEKLRKRIVLEGDVPSPTNPPIGCRFSTRCWRVTDICREVSPELKDIGGGHFVACYHL
ncbi:MAG: peptide ABC transporter substrate-binding protein [Chloroflexi bacterium GWB2_49_20]|nr:MAG: peptide ABC transporter substrate-binding protein [Chloroflexi bacterium GWB2_49_20]OGN78026.1 MAG: peptide ABC transporter substrate-binding protein [Chloroflexi bacterium GWC2_49_37]OGN85064.1 MAG: peptide ABC transporter substrate-binding protein [Chloroflexi bacterium GWD2_49_16]HBG74899.1 peptide ABC transporter substrate-binding protein [Anaerolineae bacterium]HCC78377.1 peptide ABC transporter substrate-binding protein [Anaerolineae bacterium]